MCVGALGTQLISAQLHSLNALFGRTGLGVGVGVGLGFGLGLGLGLGLGFGFGS